MDDELRSAAERHLRALAGEHARLRDDQWTAIRALVAEHRRALVVQRTGWGKSAVYFVATALLRARGGGPTVIVSPLLALMRNQVEAAARAGIRARTINSANLEDWEQVHAEIRSGSVDVLLVSPERLNNPGFRDNVLPHLTESAGLIVIDEAHCISDWGHDFRPDYRRIKTLLETLPPDIPVLATTATANERVTLDVAEQLARPVAKSATVPGAQAATLPGGRPPVPPDVHASADENPDTAKSATVPGAQAATLPGGRPPVPPDVHASADEKADSEAARIEVLVLRGALDRESLRLAVVGLATPAQRLAWLGASLSGGALRGSGIIYTLTVAAAYETAAFLREQGIEVTAYTGKDDQARRLAAEDDLLNNRVKALVATSALGMGFDKPDLGFVVHLGAPQSPVAYYQQIGRAGRGVERADVVLLPGREDRDIWAYFASLAFPPEGQVRTTIDALATAGRPLSTAAIETHVDLSRGRLEQMLKVLDVDGAVTRTVGGWTATGRPWVYDGERYQRVARERTREQQAMLAYQATDGCRMEFLRRELDDPEAAACGRCDNCTGQSWSAEVPDSDERAARDRLARPGVTVDPRKMWPTGMKELGIDASGKIAAARVAEPGRALGRFTDVGWGGPLRALLAAGAPDEPVPAQLIDPIVKVLAAWDWSTRPTSVVTMPSRSRPVLIESLGQRIAAIGRLRYVGSLGYATPDGPGPRRHNSAQRLATVWRALDVPGELRSALAASDGPVLLVDDQIDSGWTMTVAAALLRDAGAPAVLPLALASVTG